MEELSLFFGNLLDITFPFNIGKVQIIEDVEGSKRVEIEVKYDRSYQPTKEGYAYVGVHDWEKRTWVHLQIFQYPCYLVCSVPKHKYKDLTTGKVKVETYQVPWSRSGSGFSLLFEGVVLEDLKRTGQGNQTASRFGLYPQVVWRIFHSYYQENCWILEDCSGVVNLGYDESSRQKGQSYNTYFYDMDRSNLLGISEGRSSETVGEFVKKAKEKGLDADKIEAVSIDMSAAFTHSVKQYFPQAKITYDKFHVSQLVNKAFDKVRKHIAKQHHTSLNKWVFFKKNLSPEEQTLKSSLLEAYPILDQVYQHKEDFFRLWETKDPAYLQFWIDRCKDFGFKVFDTLANTLNEHFEGIIQVFKSQLNNGLLEGLNEKIQLLKRNARGYKHNSTFMKMVWLKFHDLKFST